jgi:hypothetical protein
MRTSALIPLLPLLVAGIATAHPHPHSHHGLQQTQRKSLSYGPSHPHKTFEAVDQFRITQEYDGDWKSVTKAFLGDKVGEWYIRDDVSLPSYKVGMELMIVLYRLSNWIDPCLCPTIDQWFGGI